ncbi:MAG: PorP/SprF family type IX secretion system membrane protein [Bacteroidota bacterium]
MKRLLLLVISITMLQSISAQQLPLFTQYRENASIINPAAVSHDYFLYDNPLSFGASYRVQWEGISNAPTTQTLRGEYLFADGESIGLLAGGYLINDQTGPTGFTGLYGRVGGLISDDAYYSGLSMALTFGMVQYRVNTSEIRLRETNDNISGNDLSQIFPDVGFGIYYYKLIESGFLDESRVYGGISVPQVFGLNLDFEDEDGEFSTKRVQHYYGLLGLYKYFSDDTFIEPSVWIRYVQNAPVSVDFNIRYQMVSNFWIGTGASTGGNAHLEAGFIIGENAGFDNTFKIGYGFDYSFQSFGPNVGGTHEINISYSIGE